MAVNKKISELTEYLTPTSNDLIPIVDVTGSETKKITIGNLIGDKYVRTTRFAIIGSGTSGTITIPTNSEVVLDDFGGTVDAVVSQVASSLPTTIPAKTGAAIVATTFNSIGAWSLSGTPDSYPIAIIYRVRQKLLDFDSAASNIWGVSNTEQVTKADVGLSNVDNTSDLLKPISTDTQNALNLITNVNWTGDYNNGLTYAVGDGVMFNGASFRMIAAIGAGGYPPVAYPSNWLQVTDYVSPNDIGLGNVDNTADINKPVSIPQELNSIVKALIFG
jgi:hypothetical protein